MVNNITSILKGFNDKTNPLSYDEYLILAGVEKNMGTFRAYKAFAKKLNLTKSDIIEYQENMKKESFEQPDPSKVFSCISSYQTKKTLLQEQADEINEYCSNNPSDKACACVTSVLVRVAQDEKENEENRRKYCTWKTQDDKFEQEYQARITNYNKLYKKEENELKSWRESVERKYWYKGEPTNNKYTDRNKYSMQKVDTHGVFLWQTYDWDVIYTTNYITEQLKLFKLGKHPDNVSPRIRINQPIINPRNSVIPCCNNNIYAPSANLERINQVCNQTIILDPEQMEEIKRQQEQEEEERKQKEEEEQEEEAAIIAAELASAKKKKIIFLILLIILILLGISAFMYFNLSKQPIVSTTQSSIPSTTQSSIP